MAGEVSSERSAAIESDGHASNAARQGIEVWDNRGDPLGCWAGLTHLKTVR